MTLFRLLRRNWFFHFRANLAVLLGVAVGTAVLAGALMVGDSLRGSLRQQVEKRLAGVQSVLAPGRFGSFRGQDWISKHDDLVRAIMLPAALTAESGQGVQTVGQVNLLAVEPSRLHQIQGGITPAYTFSWRIWEIIPRLRPPVFPTGDLIIPDHQISADELWVSPHLARQLGVSTGDRINVRLPRLASVHRDSTFGRKTADDISTLVPLKARVVVDSPLTSFNLASDLRESRTVVADVTTIAAAVGKPGLVNALLSPRQPSELPADLVSRVATLRDFDLVVRTPSTRAASLLERWSRDKQQLMPRDYRRRLAESMILATDADGNKSLTKDELDAYYSRRGAIDLESESLLLPPAAEKAAHAVANELNIPATSTLVYLANSISDGTNEIPYSVIAAVDPQLPAPLGPYLDPHERPLADDEILLADWPESPLTAKPGDVITVRYFLPESDGKATETTATFKLRGRVPLKGVGADPYLAPEFPGITDRLTLGDWDPPFPYDNSKIKKRDEDFWDRYRATPKAYVNQAVGRKLFGSRFGNATSVRFAATSSDDARRINDALLNHLKPEDFGLVFEDVRTRALDASQRGTDFGGLFLGFSCFLIAGSLMLVSLMWKLNLDQRASEIGLLFASGFRVNTVRRLLLMEGLLIAKVGILLGLMIAIGFCQLLLTMLARLWPDGRLALFLSMHVEPKTALIGMFAMLALVGVTIWWSLRSLRRVAPVGLLRGVLAAANENQAASSIRGKWSMLAVVCCLLGGIAAAFTGSSQHHHEARAGAFFSAGGLWLIAGLLYFRRSLRYQFDPQSSPAQSPTQLGRRHVARHPGRSMLTAGLIAFAAFLLIAVEAFRRTPDADFGKQGGGSGGFDLIATTELPLFQDLSDPATGRKEMLDSLERAYQKDPATKMERLKRAEELLARSELFSLRYRAGDEAGCSNLARPDKPRLVGVPQRLIERGGFAFASLIPADASSNPWTRLLEHNGSIPVFGENNTVKWMLNKSLGDSIPAKDGRGQEVDLRLVGLLQDSIFQGELVLSEQQFLQLYPDTQGYQVVLAIAPSGRADELRTLLETAYADRGLAATPTVERLRSYLAIENTYLSTFQLLGGFGLLLGACGLAVVQLRNAMERRGELALLRALGWPARVIGKMLRAENAVPLFVGIGIGAVAALGSIAPMLYTGEASVRPLLRVAILLAGVVIVGAAAGALAIRATLRAPIVPALRNE